MHFTCVGVVEQMEACSVVIRRCSCFFKDFSAENWKKPRICRYTSVTANHKRLDKISKVTWSDLAT